MCVPIIGILTIPNVGLRKLYSVDGQYCVLLEATRSYSEISRWRHQMEPARRDVSGRMSRQCVALLQTEPGDRKLHCMQQ